MLKVNSWERIGRRENTQPSPGMPTNGLKGRGRGRRRGREGEGEGEGEEEGRRGRPRYLLYPMLLSRLILVPCNIQETTQGC